MDLIQALILSIVEGVTEFLPVSSTGHLLLASDLLKISQTEFVKSFEIFIQLGAILAVVVLFWKKLIGGIGILKNIIAAFIPTAIIGFLLYDFIKAVLFENILITIAALFIGGILLIVIEKLPFFRHSREDGNPKIDSIEKLSLRQSFLIGVAQAVSVIPGTSRAAASVVGGMLVGASRKTAVEFSFLLAIPTIAAATFLDLVKSDFNFSSNEVLLSGVGFIGSFITALVVVKWFIKYVQTNNLFWFGVYRIILALVFLLLFYF